MPSQLFEYRLRSDVVRLHAWSLLWLRRSIAVENRAVPPFAMTAVGSFGNDAALDARMESAKIARPCLS